MISCRQGHTGIDRTLQFSDIPWPIVAQQNLHRFGRQRPERLSVALTYLLEKRVREQGNVFFALTKRRDAYLNDVEPIIEIFPKFSLPDKRSEIPIRCRDQTNFRVDALVPADAFEDARVESAQKFDLNIGINFADFIQEERSACGLFESADASLGRSSECPALMTEKLAFDQLRCERRTVKRNKTRLVAIAEIMDRVRDQFLAGPALADEKNCGAARGHLANGVEDFMHRPGFTDQVFQTETFIYLMAELNIFLLRLASLDSPRDLEPEFVDVYGLGHKVVSAALHRFDGSGNRAISGHQQANRRSWSLKDLLDQRHPVFPAQPQVGQDQIDMVRIKDRQGFLRIACRVNVELILERPA